MNCIFWNCQGIGSTLTVEGIGELIRSYRPGVLFLLETRGTTSSIERLKRRFNMFDIAVDRVGLSGSLALLWRKDLRVELLGYSKSHIDALIHLQDGTQTIRLTGVYVAPLAHMRTESWNLLRTL